MELEQSELKWCSESPEILREIAECHECEYTAASAMGEGLGQWHLIRKRSLLAKAQEIEDSF